MTIPKIPLPFKAVVLLVTLLLTATLVMALVVRWDKNNILREVDLRCAYGHQAPDQFWDLEANGGPVGCVVEGHFQGGTKPHSFCDAKVQWTNADGSTGEDTIEPKDGNKAFKAPHAKALRFSCNSSGEPDDKDKCNFKIESITCDPRPLAAAGALGRNWPGAAGLPTSGRVPCGTEKSPIFKAPRGQACSVTLKWTGTEKCKSIVKANYIEPESERDVDTTKEDFKTFVRVKKLSLECKGESRDTPCTYEISSIECSNIP